MGMSIDEAISWLVSIAEYVGDDVPIYDEDTVAIETAMNIMRKYQKIEQLVKFYKNAGEIPIFVLEGVLEDGNDD
jgi:hypothetical protein